MLWRDYCLATSVVMISHAASRGNSGEFSQSQLFNMWGIEVQSHMTRIKLSCFTSVGLSEVFSPPVWCWSPASKPETMKFHVGPFRTRVPEQEPTRNQWRSPIYQSIYISDVLMCVDWTVGFIWSHLEENNVTNTQDITKVYVTADHEVPDWRSRTWCSLIRSE